MSKITNVLNMYRLILENKCISPKDIASELEVSIRQIKTYKLDMINAGIPIKTKKGRGGGYYIDTFHDTSFRVSHIDDDIVLDSLNFLKEHEYVYIDAIAKILGADSNDSSVFKLKKKRDSYEAIKKNFLYYPLINKAIKNNNKINIVYKASNNAVSERVVYPIKLIEYLDSYYFVAYCTLRSKNRLFKLSRIEKLENMYSKYDKRYVKEIKNQMDESYGLYFGEKVEVKLIISKPFSTIVKEKLIVENQKITDLDEGVILFEASMHGIEEILSWILSMGKYVKVLGDEKLVVGYKKMLEEMLGNTI